MKIVLAVLVVTMTSFFPQGEGPQKAMVISNVVPSTATIVFVNGNIYTGTSKVPAQAMAVADGKIIWTGTNDQAKLHHSAKAEIVDLGGHFVMPGFNDAHIHLANGGFEQLNVELVGCKSLDEMKQRIAEHAKAAAPGEWLQGGGWDHTLWTEQNLPTREDIDSVTGDHPAIFSRVDGHIAIANTAALKAGGVDANTPDPQGGKIDRRENGDATGILRETAQGLVDRKIPAPTPERRRRAVEVALKEAAQWGLTSVQDNSSWEDFLVYEQLEKEGKLTLRISEWLPFDASVEQLRQMRSHHSQYDSMLHTGMLKGFMDGSLGSRTAAMLAPYSDDPKNSGIPRYDQQKLDQIAIERANAGFQLGFHAIGDRGSRMALDAFAKALNNGAKKDRRFRIEHAQIIAPEDFKKFKDLGVIASMQPNHLLTDMNWAESRVGPERAKHSYAWKEFLDDGVPLAFGTDYPVEPLTPFRGLYAAITRKNEAGTKDYFPEQKLNIDQAIFAYTVGPAFAEFDEKSKGVLAPGMVADFVVLDRDITKVAPEEVLKTRVLRTVVGGKTVYQAN